MIPCYLVIANPEGKRWQHYARELAGFWERRGIRPDVCVLPWREVVPRDGNLDGLTGFDQPALVRLESPGRDAGVMMQLLEAGGRTNSAELPAWRGQTYRKGLLLRPGLMHLGFCRVLSGLRHAFDQRPHLRPLACPLLVAELFDKRATGERLAAASIPTPAVWPTAANAADIVSDLRERGVRTAYVKLNTGSSATGIAVLRACDDPPWAATTLIRMDGGFFSTRRLQRVVGSELEATLDFLVREDALVQEGIPMAQIDGQNFDVRVVMLHGSPRFTVFRLSNAPMTNLHLGGRRGDPDLCRSAIPRRIWLDALDHCREAARLYPCAALGIDLLFERGFLRHYILEINAFGDFFPGLRNEHGQTVHAAEIEETARLMWPVHAARCNIRAV